MRRLLAVACLAGASLAAPAVAQADFEVPIPRPPDSDAPPGSPPHWIPNEAWVHGHWLPFDEARLYALVKTNRTELWAWLRDDNHTVAQLAAQRGWPDARKLAAALVAPRVIPRPMASDDEGMPMATGAHAHGEAGRVTPAVLRARAFRVLDQGHLAQHVIFHSLHQEAGPSAAETLFGVSGPKEFQALRRLDIGPLTIGRAHGRTRRQTQSALEAELREEIAHGVEKGDVSARQGAMLLRRQLRQVPRWLGEDHYNGPPPTQDGKPVHPFRASFSAPDLSGDASTVMFDSAQPAPPLAVAFGEVNLAGRRLGDGTAIDPRDASLQARADHPCSTYNVSLSNDGAAAAFEIQAGNRTFAKRYGNVAIAVADLRSGAIRRVAGGPVGRATETAYDPVLSGDGRVLAFQAARADALSPSSATRTQVVVLDLATGRRTAVPGDAYEPSLSADGRRVAYSTWDADGKLVVEVRDLGSGRTWRAGRGSAEAWEPSLSGDGTRVAFAAMPRPGARSAVYVRRVSGGKAALVSDPKASADSPSLAADGRTVAFTVQEPGARPSAMGRPGQRVVVRDLRTGGTVAVALGGWSGEPSLSADGTRVALSTDARTTEPGPGGLQVMVADASTGEPTVVSPDEPVTSFDTAMPLDPGTAGATCDLRPPAW